MDLQEIIQSAKDRIDERDRFAARQPIAANRAWTHAGDLVSRHRAAIRSVLEGYASRSPVSGPCDREKAEHAVRAAYDAINRLPPRFIWFDSPIAGAGAAALISLDHATFHFAPQDWARMIGQLGFNDNALLTDDFLDAARGSRSNELEECIFGEQNFLEIAFTDHDARIANALRAHWRLTWEKENLPPKNPSIPFQPVEHGPPPITFPEKELPEEYERVNKEISSFSNYAKGSLIIGVLSAMLRVQPRMNRLHACRLGSGDAWELAVIEACDLFGHGKGPAFEPLAETMRECGWWWPFASTCVMVDRPTDLVMQSWRLHNPDGPALRYRDNFQLFFLRDLMVAERIALGKFAAGEIDRETNIELRRVMVERFGVERYLFATGAERVHEDECGVLYRKTLNDDEDIAMVQVINSTAEPDGTFKHYFLRVPPHITTPRAGIAWTFGLDEEDYEPTLQT